MGSAACGTYGAEPTNGRIVLDGGDGQVDTVGKQLSTPYTVLVTDDAGLPLPGVIVGWSVTSGGGSVSTASTATDASGIARTIATLGTTVGAQAVRATASGYSGSPIGFTATGVADAPSQLSQSAGDGQDGARTRALAQPLAVLVRDRYDNPVEGATVNWTVTVGGGSVAGPTSMTTAGGIASMTLTLGPSLGVNAVNASVAGVAGTVTFTATGVPVVTLVKQLPIPENYGIHDTYVREGIAFVFAWNTGVIIYDVGNGMKGGSPANPVEISRLVTTGGKVHNGWWFQNQNTGEKKYLFIGEEGPGSIGSSSSGDIHVVDVSDLNSPVEVASFRLSGAGTHNFWMDEQAEILYAAFYNGGVVALDVSGTLAGDLATQGRVIANLKPGGTGNTYVWGVQLYNGSVYATDMISGFWQLSASDLSTQGGGSNVPERYGSDQWVQNGYAYSGTWGFRSQPGNAVKVWELGPSGAPTLVDSVITTSISTVSDLEVSPDGKLLMFSTEGGGNNGVHFYSLANPARPTYLTKYLVSSGVHTATMATINGRLYAFGARDPSGAALLILDITDAVP